MASPVARAILTLGIIVFFHAAYSTYEHLSMRKALDQPAGETPIDIIIETLLSLTVIVVGVSLTAAPLKEITWASEMRKRTIDEVDARPSFALLNHRGTTLFGTEGL